MLGDSLAPSIRMKFSVRTAADLQFFRHAFSWYFVLVDGVGILRGLACTAQ